ncbi:unnamed protein product, partial [Prorocentrum cordatum]
MPRGPPWSFLSAATRLQALSLLVLLLAPKLPKWKPNPPGWRLAPCFRRVGVRCVFVFLLLLALPPSVFHPIPLVRPQVTEGEVEGKPCEIAEWRIGHLPSKLKGCMGKALVSPPFTAAGHEDVRLMVFPEGKDAAKGPRSKRQKELYAKKVSEGPLDGCLKMKFVPEDGSLVLEYYLSVGSERPVGAAR